MHRGGFSLITVVYLVVGAVIATQHHFFDNLNTVKLVLSALLAIVAWPLILLGVNLHIH
ncbi:MAG: hypothetical protein ACXVQR_05935 [Solirubrobacteraceae bacterium]